MTDLRAAAEQALEALLTYPMTEGKAIETLRQALAQPEQVAMKQGWDVDTLLAQPEQSSSMDEWRSMVVVNLLRRCPNLSKHELRELAAHFESRLPVAQPEQEPVAWVKEGNKRVGFGRIEVQKYVQFDQTLLVGTKLYTAPPSTSGYAKKIESLIKERDELRQALAQPEQGCAECGVKASDGYALYCVACTDLFTQPEQDLLLGLPVMPDDLLRQFESQGWRYAKELESYIKRLHTQQAQPWVSLTDDEAYQLLVDYCDDDLGLLNAIEAALREKNNG